MVDTSSSAPRRAVTLDTETEMDRVKALVQFVDIMTKQHATDYADAVTTLCGAMVAVVGRAPNPEGMIAVLDICAASLVTARTLALESLQGRSPLRALAVRKTTTPPVLLGRVELRTDIVPIACPACNGPCFAPCDSNAERIDCVECDARLVTRCALGGEVSLEVVQ